MNKNYFKVFEINTQRGCGHCSWGLLADHRFASEFWIFTSDLATTGLSLLTALVCVSLYACRCLSGRLTGDIRMQRRASMATVRRRVSEDGAGGLSRSQLNAIQQVLEGGVKVVE